MTTFFSEDGTTVIIQQSDENGEMVIAEDAGLDQSIETDTPLQIADGMVQVVTAEEEQVRNNVSLVSLGLV